jgi:hypothetical protein
VVQRRLCSAVGTPALVGLDGGVGGDADQAAGTAAQQGQRGLGERQRGERVHGQHRLDVVERLRGEGRQRGGAERARVVDQQVESAGGLHGLDQTGSVTGVPHIARHGGDDVRSWQPVDGEGQPHRVAPVEHDPPSPFDEGGHEGEAEAPAAAGDQGDRRRR